jgi:hypothetical protein
MAEQDVTEQIRRATAAQQQYTDELLKYPNVVGVAVGYVKERGEQKPQIGLIVMVDNKLPEAQLSPEEIIPRQLDGVRVDVQEMGTFTA